MCKKEYCISLNAGKLPNEFVNRETGYEKYVLVYSYNLYKTLGSNVTGNYESHDQFEGLVKICYQGKTVYRKCMAFNGVKKDQILIGYRTQTQLGIKNDDFTQSVCIAPAKWYSYLAHHIDSYVKYPFIIAIISVIITILSFPMAVACFIKAFFC